MPSCPLHFADLIFGLRRSERLRKLRAVHWPAKPATG